MLSRILGEILRWFVSFYAIENAMKCPTVIFDIFNVTGVNEVNIFS